MHPPARMMAEWGAGENVDGWRLAQPAEEASHANDSPSPLVTTRSPMSPTAGLAGELQKFPGAAPQSAPSLPGGPQRQLEMHVSIPPSCAHAAPPDRCHARLRAVVLGMQRGLGGRMNRAPPWELSCKGKRGCMPCRESPETLFASRQDLGKLSGAGCKQRFTSPKASGPQM